MDEEPVRPDQRPRLLVVEAGIAVPGGNHLVADPDQRPRLVADDRPVEKAAHALRPAYLELGGVAPQLARSGPARGQLEDRLAVRLAAEAHVDLEGGRSVLRRGGGSQLVA